MSRSGRLKTSVTPPDDMHQRILDRAYSLPPLVYDDDDDDRAMTNNVARQTQDDLVGKNHGGWLEGSGDE